MANPSISIGDIITNNIGIECVVVEYVDASEVYVQFKNGDIIPYLAVRLRDGKFSNNNYPTLYGVGCLGYGRHKTRESGVKTKKYSCWKDMISRCYNKRSCNYARYGDRGVTVCDEWHIFQNFGEFYDEHYEEGFQLDKDIKIAGNKIYSPDRCMFVTQKANLDARAFINNNNKGKAA